MKTKLRCFHHINSKSIEVVGWNKKRNYWKGIKGFFYTEYIAYCRNCRGIIHFANSKLAITDKSKKYKIEDAYEKANNWLIRRGEWEE